MFDEGYVHLFGFPGSSVVKNLPPKQETWVRSLGQKDPLEKEVATHSSILAWEIPRTGEFGEVHGKKDNLSMHACMCLYRHSH